MWRAIVAKTSDARSCVLIAVVRPRCDAHGSDGVFARKMVDMMGEELRCTLSKCGCHGLFL